MHGDINLGSCVSVSVCQTHFCNCQPEKMQIRQAQLLASKSGGTLTWRGYDTIFRQIKIQNSISTCRYRLVNLVNSVNALPALNPSVCVCVVVVVV